MYLLVLHLQLCPLRWNCCALLEDAIIAAPSPHPICATFAVARAAVVSDAVAEVATFSAMIVELATIKTEVSIADASDEVSTAAIPIKLLLIRALDGGMFSSIFIFISAIFDLVEGIPDGAGELLATTIAAAL